MFEQPLTTSLSADRQDILSDLLDTMRHHVTPHQGICAASDLIFKHYDCQGALLKSSPPVQNKTETDSPVSLFHDPFEAASILSGSMAQTIFQHISAPDSPKEDLFTFDVDEIHALVCYQKLRQNEWAVLLLWRMEAWQKADKKIIAYFWQIAALLMETENLYLTAIQKTQHDPATGVMTWPALRQTILRRLPRLDRDGLSGTLILLQINGLSELTLSYGPEIEEKTLLHSVTVMQYAIRPTDLIGRIGGPLFVIWLDGADRYAAAERAESMTKRGIPLPFLQKTTLSLQMGLVCREAGNLDTIDDLLEQATIALRNTSSGKTNRLWYFSRHNI